MVLLLVIQMLMSGPPGAGTAGVKGAKMDGPVKGWRLREPLEIYEREAVSEVMPDGTVKELNSPYFFHDEWPMSARFETGKLRAMFGEPKAPRYPGHIRGVAHRNGVTIKGWWLEKVDENGRFEGVVVYFLAGRQDSNPVFAMRGITTEFYRRAGIPPGHSKGVTPASKISYTLTNALKAKL